MSLSVPLGTREGSKHLVHYHFSSSRVSESLFLYPSPVRPPLSSRENGGNGWTLAPSLESVHRNSRLGLNLGRLSLLPLRPRVPPEERVEGVYGLGLWVRKWLLVQSEPGDLVHHPGTTVELDVQGRRGKEESRSRPGTTIRPWSGLSVEVRQDSPGSSPHLFGDLQSLDLLRGPFYPSPPVFPSWVGPPVTSPVPTFRPGGVGSGRRPILRRAAKAPRPVVDV